MTPEERQLLTTLADRVRSAPAQQKDMEADQFLRQLVQERPDTVYILAQTVLMQDFALRNAQAQIEELKQQCSQQQAPASGGSGSFLGGLFGGNAPQPQPRPAAGSVPRVNPWADAPSQNRAGDYAAPPPPQSGYPQYPPAGPVMQPSQTSGFLRSAATTAAGVAGGALLFEGINSLFSGHHGGMLGGNFSNMTPAGSLSEETVVNNYYGDKDSPAGSDRYDAAYDADDDRDDGITDASYDDSGDDGDNGGGDYA